VGKQTSFIEKAGLPSASSETSVLFLTSILSKLSYSLPLKARVPFEPFPGLENHLFPFGIIPCLQAITSIPLRGLGVMELAYHEPLWITNFMRGA